MAYADTVLADAPLAYYRLGEASGTTMVDSSGNSRNGAITAGTPTFGVTGALIGDANTAWTFNGSQFAQVSPYAAWMQQTVFTVEVWVKTTQTSIRAIVDRDFSNTGINRAWQLRMDANGTVNFTKIAGGVVEAKTTQTINDGNWHHVVATHDGTRLRIYIDAVERLNVAMAALGSSTAPFGIAANSSAGTGASYRFIGSLDEIAYYGTALSAQRILAHYNAGTTNAAAPVEATGALSGVGTLSAASRATQIATGPLSSEGTLTATTSRPGETQTATGALSGEGVLTAQGSVFAPQAGFGALSGEGTLAATEDSGRIIIYDLILGLLDPVIDQAPSSLTAVAYEGAPNQEVEFRIDGVAVHQLTLGTEGELPPTSIPVPDWVMAGDHVLTVAPVTDADVTTEASTTFTVHQDPNPSPYLAPQDADPVEVPGALLSTGVRRWVLQDLMPGGLGSWIFPANPDAAAALPLGRRELGQRHTLSTDGRFDVTEGVGIVRQWSFSGKYFTKAFQDQLLAYAALNRRLYLIDHRNRAWTIAIVGVDLTPRLRIRDHDGHANDQAGAYTVRCLIFEDWKEPQ